MLNEEGLDPSHMRLVIASKQHDILQGPAIIIWTVELSLKYRQYIQEQSTKNIIKSISTALVCTICDVTRSSLLTPALENGPTPKILGHSILPSELHHSSPRD
jgi:hypothetical protein